VTGVGVAAVVLGAGAGSRVGAGVNKVLLPLAGVPALARSVATALAVPEVTCVVVVARPGEEQQVSVALGPVLPEGTEVLMVTGGLSRHDSEWAALRVLRPRIEDGEVDVVVVHDGARPLATVDLYERVVAAARSAGGGIPVVPASGLVDADGRAAPPGLGGVQTPQAFDARALLGAYARAAEDGFTGTDTAACLERYEPTLRIAAVPSSPLNVKVTWAEDLAVVERLLDRA
jgi:2-C-methyl-D-erythritol 4-phosphate cytidylyltransferase